MSLKNALDLSGRKAIVTGGSRGLGLQIAEALGEMGAEVLVAARKEDELREAVEHLRQLGVTAHYACADFGRPESVTAFADAALGQLGQCDILVNNAGASWGAPAEDYPLEGWQKLLNLNLTGTFVLTQTIGKRSMIPRRYGRILNVASVAGLRGNPISVMQTIGYNTTKGGVVNFTRALAAEWGRYGITVNALAPGYFPSKMTRATLDKIEQQLLQTTPLQRIGDDEDLKGAAVLFCSNAGKHITGQILAVDGGASAI
ncbi:MAG: SDR family oxidoreductase [Burkholderiaceae bacterium]